jgi:Bacterial type II and III secretion system protein
MKTQKPTRSPLLRMAAFSLPAMFLAPVSEAQTSTTVQPTSPQSLVNADPNYEAVRERLLNQPEGDVTFDRASLSTVLRMLATKAGIKWLSAQQNKDWDKQLVTLSMNASPFAALETIADEYGIALVYDRGVWHMRPYNDSELIARTYVIKYNTAEKAEGDTVGGSDTASGGMSGGGGGYGGGGYGGGGFGGGGFGGGGFGGGGGGFGMGMDLGTVGTNFKVEAKALTENVEKLLGIGTSGLDANVAANFSVDEFSNSPMRLQSRPRAVESETGGEKGPEPTVVWNSDGNTLFVVATRQQHQMVGAYLATLDQPQPLIAVEFKFVETTKDPKSQLGIDWSGTLDGGYPFNLTGLDMTVDLNNIGDTQLPTSAILSPGDMNVKLNFLLKDRQTSTVSYPRVLTLNNRSVSMRSVVNFPVLAASSSVSAGTGTSTSQVAFMPIGTTVNILPKQLGECDVLMQTKVVVANVIGEEIIDGNTYPVPSSRVYTSPLKVRSGYTVAIAGLDEATDSRSGTGIPVLSRIPILGWAFKNRYKDRTRKNLMIFITPTIIMPNGRGITETPLSEVPRYFDDQPLNPPAFHINGELVGGPDKLGEAILWADREERRLSRVCEEGRGTKAVYDEITKLSGTIAQLQGYANAVATQSPSMGETLSLRRYNLEQLSRRTVILQRTYFKNIIHTPGI